MTEQEFFDVIAELNEDERQEVLEYVHALAAGDYEKCHAMEAAHGMCLTCLTPFWRVRGLDRILSTEHRKPLLGGTESK